MRRALVLAGGGARGAYQAGMLQELVVNKGLDFQILRGVSVGALNAAFLAQASTQANSLSNLKRKVKSLYNLWRYEIKGNHSVYAERGGFAGIIAGMDSLYSLEPLRALINKHVKPKYLRNSGRDFKVGTVSLVSARYNEWGPNDTYFMDKLIASASIPVVFPYVDLKSAKEVLVDGGVRNISPLSSAFDAQPDEIYVLLTSRLIKDGLKLPDSGVQEHDYEKWDDNWLGTKVSGLDVLKRTIEILTDEIYLDDIRGALEWNEIIKNIETVRQASQTHTLPDNIAKTIAELTSKIKKRHVPLFVIAPQEWYGDENKSTEFSPSLIEQAINHGREIAADPSRWVWP
jgi:NTE family protein